MQLQSGQRLGPYEILERIGAGGMGEVYRARDSRLSRYVAIKVLQGALRDEPRLRARFDREAKVISSLNDPHICALHDIGSHNGVDYLVLEYCDGITLAQRLDRGPLTIEQVLQFGNEIARALSRAHRAGIIHRDLKPSNIMLTKSGVKLLDFGLAKPAVIRTSGESAETTALREPISQEGSFLGTVKYMAPEVLSGSEADARADIFALGVVLYEMLTGKPAFSGTSTPSIMAAILEREPQTVRELQPRTPPALEHIIVKSLAKNPDERWESAHDIAEGLRWISDSANTPPLAKSRRYVALGVAGAVLLVLAAAAEMLWLRQPQSDRVTRLSIQLGERSDGATSDRQTFTLTGFDLSRDGSRVAYSYCDPCDSHGTNSRIYVRYLNSFETVPLPGTEGGGSPFFSPDGQWVAFFVSGQLRKIPVTGGTPQVVTNQSYWFASGMWWAPDGTIYFAPGSSDGLWSVPVAGGSPRRVTVPNAARGENSHRWPQVLPGGQHVLFTIRTMQMTSFDQARLAVLSLKTGTWKVVLEGGSYGRYVSDQLLFARAGALYAVPFDLASTSVRGAPRKVMDGMYTSASSGSGGYRVSEDGDLVFVAGGVTQDRTEILAVDRAGRSRVLATLPVRAYRPKLSPDGRKLAIGVSAANDDIWLYDFESAVATRFSFQPGDEWGPIWTPDGTRLIYTAGATRVLSQRTDGSADVVELLRSDAAVIATSCSPDGKAIVYTVKHPQTDNDVWILPLEGDRRPRPLLRSPFSESLAKFSRDGKWIAYVAEEAQRREVYVRPLTGAGRSQISSAGAAGPPTWSIDGKELFYLQDGDMVAVPVTPERAGLRPGKPQILFTAPPDGSFFEVTNDGFLFLRNLDPSQPREIKVILNWKRELLP